MLEPKITKQATKFLRQLQKNAKHSKQVTEKIKALLEHPEPPDSQWLKGYDAPRHRRVDIGEYRVVYRYDEQFLYVAAVGKRNDGEVYKVFHRLYQSIKGPH